MSTNIPKNLPLPVYTPGGTKETWMAHLRACRDVHRHNRKLAALRKAERMEKEVRKAAAQKEEGKS